MSDNKVPVSLRLSKEVIAFIDSEKDRVKNIVGFSPSTTQIIELFISKAMDENK